MRSFYYNIDDAEFVDANGEKIPRFAPELFYQEHAVWRIFLRDRENLVRDLSGIAAWSAAIDCDYSSGTAPMCRTLDDGIGVDTATGMVTVELDAATAGFLAAVNGVPRRRAFFELCGFNSDGERALCLEFEIFARMIIDPDPAVSPETPDTVATKAFVSAYVRQSGAITSGAEIDTVIGDTRITATSSGGVVVQVGGSGGATVRISSGAVVASGTSGESVVLSGGEVRAAVGDEDYQAHVTVTAGGVNINCSDITNDATVAVTPDAVAVSGGNGVAFTINGHPVELVTVIDSETTSASIAELAGGTAYIFTQPLDSLSVASVESSTQEAWLEFTVASGGSVSIDDSGYKYLGGRPSAFEGGSSYSVGFRWGRQAVCNPVEA